MNEINTILNTEIISFGKFQITGWEILFVIAVYCIAKFALFLIKRWIYRYNRKRNIKGFDGNSTAIFKLIKYVIWVFTFVIMLDIIHVKLSFLLAGSAALLVGVGFGLQQIFQDLISGIFILIERNVKLGDIMEVDNYVGRISNIGLRTSTIITRDGTNITVPNHKFINDNVLNWSNAERIIRFKISVGVAYGSDVELVKRLLREAANEHPDIVNDQDHNIQVRLVEFADSALIFDLLFWTTTKLTVEDMKSDIRLSALSKFNANQVSIPFPQRDLHLKHTSESIKNAI